MGVFMERLQRSTSLSDTGIVPGYLRTHPVTVERIADAVRALPAANSSWPAKASISITCALLRSYGRAEDRGGVLRVRPRRPQVRLRRPPVTAAAALLRARCDSGTPKREIATGGNACITDDCRHALGQVLCRTKKSRPPFATTSGRSPNSPPTGSFTTICRRCCCGRRAQACTGVAGEKSCQTPGRCATAGTAARASARRVGDKCGNTASSASSTPGKTNLRAPLTSSSWHRRLVMATTTKSPRQPRARVEAGNAGCETETNERSLC